MDKFKGRANKIDKNGITKALEPIKGASPPQTEKVLPTQRKRLASLDHSSHSPEHETPKVDLDKLIPSNPESKNHLNYSKRSTPNKIAPNKL